MDKGKPASRRGAGTEDENTAHYTGDPTRIAGLPKWKIQMIRVKPTLCRNCDDLGDPTAVVSATRSGTVFVSVNCDHCGLPLVLLAIKPEEESE